MLASPTGPLTAAAPEAASPTLTSSATVREAVAAIDALLDLASTGELTDSDATRAWRVPAVAATSQLVSAGVLSPHLQVDANDPPWLAARTLVAAQRMLRAGSACLEAPTKGRSAHGVSGP